TRISGEIVVDLVHDAREVVQLREQVLVLVGELPRELTRRISPRPLPIEHDVQLLDRVRTGVVPKCGAPPISVATRGNTGKDQTETDSNAHESSSTAREGGISEDRAAPAQAQRLWRGDLRLRIRKERQRERQTAASANHQPPPVGAQQAPETLVREVGGQRFHVRRVASQSEVNRA